MVRDRNATPPIRWWDVEGGRLPSAWLGRTDRLPVAVLPGLTDGIGPLSEPATQAALADDTRQSMPFRLLLLSYRVPLPARVSTAELARDVAAVLDRIVDRPIAVTGHSMGGMVAQHLAALRPDLVDRLVLSATAAAADDALRAVLGRWDDLIAAGRWRAFYRDAIDTSFTGVARVRRRAQLRLGPAQGADRLAPRHHALSGACQEHDAADLVARIKAPTLVLNAEHDPLAHPDRGRELARLLPDARFRRLRGVAHGFPEQARRTYERTTAAFLGVRI